jgi:hypothetical protein
MSEIKQLHEEEKQAWEEVMEYAHHASKLKRVYHRSHSPTPPPVVVLESEFAKSVRKWETVKKRLQSMYEVKEYLRTKGEVKSRTQ